MSHKKRITNSHKEAQKAQKAQERTRTNRNESLAETAKENWNQQNKG